ncbi:DUF2530 domain-containing protein [Bifidobacterium aemilianum]|uniref:DUF2530 domain-containing protein n=1 Tax=Bifidobacterium aemilianum TaxID=2493120 RepID=A0A366K8A9_9BIFI|nr:DUF2530 domain-containing protein [Bifidobacterium aemilianum]RBP97398.1 DUF2530 domain-containing protein [Bifidobacterium aemilianum]
MKLAPIFNPDARRAAPKPIRVDLRKVFVIGTSLWTVALLVSLILLLLDVKALPLVVVCASGVLIGLAMLVWEHFDRWNYRRLGK